MFKCGCKDASAWTSAVNQIHWGIWSADKNVNASKYVPNKHATCCTDYKSDIPRKALLVLWLSVWRFSSHKQYENRCSFEMLSLSVDIVSVSMPDGQRLHRVQTEICILQN